MYNNVFTEIREVVMEVLVKFVRIAVNVDFHLFPQILLTNIVDGIGQESFEQKKIGGFRIHDNLFQMR